jgi:adenylosuccinate lyase
MDNQLSLSSIITNNKSKNQFAVFDEFFESRAWAFWFEHLSWLEKMGFKHSYKKQSPTIEEISNKKHRIVEYLQKFVCSTQFCNAHWGLTSSDVEDNIYLSWLSSYNSLIRNNSMTELFHQLLNKEGPKYLMARTHGVPAEPKFFKNVMNCYAAALQHHIDIGPAIISAKSLGGPVGSLSLDMRNFGLDFDESRFKWSKFGLAIPINKCPIQSTDYVEEMQIISWMSGLASIIHKIANDMRLHIMLGQAKIIRPAGSAGSSSMAHKHNPIIFERACSRCKSVMNQANLIPQLAASNWMERSLDTSWSVRRVYVEVPTQLANAIQDLHDGMKQLSFNQEDCILAISSSNHQHLMKTSFDGESRWAEYSKQLNDSEEL